MFLERTNALARRVVAAATLAYATGLACAASPTEVTDEVIVEATRLEIERRVSAFVSGITHRGYAVKPLARWLEPICPLVAGIPGDQGEFILQGVSEAALAAGAPLAPAKCRPNFLVVLTPDPDAVLKLWPKRAPRLFGGATPSAVRRVMSELRPVRVWYNVAVVCADNVYAAPPGSTNLGVSSPMGGDCRLNDSRLEWSYVNGFSSVLVIVDMDDIKETPLGPLTDYIAMVGLAKLDLDGAWGDAPTILRLFAAPGDAASHRLSAWDAAFLKALYRTSQNARFQRTTIADQMVRDLVVPPQRGDNVIPESPRNPTLTR